MNVNGIVSELKRERDRLDKAIRAVSEIAGKEPASTSWKRPSNVISITRGKRRLSPAARRRISQAQKRRWAKVKRAA